MAKILRERFIEGLTKVGETKIKETLKYVVYSRKQGGFYYLGRAGALRFGPSLAKSIPVPDVRKQILLGERDDPQKQHEERGRERAEAEGRLR